MSRPPSAGPGPNEPGFSISPIRHFYGFADDVVEVVLHEAPQHTPRPPEALVHTLWAERRFDEKNLETTTGLPIHILSTGTKNTDAGPDFRNARLLIGDTTWVGDVEIHVRSAEWYDHRHHEDARYNSVVLHITLFPDVWTGNLLRADGTAIPELILSPCLTESFRNLLYRFNTQPGPAPVCAPLWNDLSQEIKMTWARESARKRLLAKRDRLANAYLALPDLDELLHQLIFAGLGYAKNTDAMITLAERIPLAVARTINDPLDLEALHLGVAGLLPTEKDLLQADRITVENVMELRYRFERLNAGLAIPVMSASSWQFFRLRPANFPPLRIAQAASLLSGKDESLFGSDPVGKLVSALQAQNPLNALRDCLKVSLSPFWQTHVRLDRRSHGNYHKIGEERVDTLIVNAFSPILLLYAEQQELPEIEELVFRVLEKVRARSDEVTRLFSGLGARQKNVLEAQGLHQIYRSFCRELKCLECGIGKALLVGKI